MPRTANTAPTKAPIALKPRVGTDVTSLKDAGATIGKAVIEGRAIVLQKPFSPARLLASAADYLRAGTRFRAGS